MSTKANINTLEYWNRRFGSGDWESKGGFSQTRAFAESQVDKLDLPSNFAGVLCDFGCGAGDAFPVYRQAFPNAKLIGVDFSQEAINLCQTKYSNLAEFYQGGHEVVPDSDVIITSNVLEHIENDQEIVEILLKKCTRLYIIVPYREKHLISEHLRSYDKDSFSKYPVIKTVIFPSRGWSEYGWQKYVSIYIKNIFRLLLNRPLRRRNMQIMFDLQGVYKKSL